jgi:hypothetical protein
MDMEEDKGLGKHGKSSAASAPGELERGVPPERDETLQHPRCVFQLLKKHYRRYTPEMIELICGVSKDLFLQVCEEICENSGREKPTSFPTRSAGPSTPTASRTGGSGLGILSSRSRAHIVGYHKVEITVTYCEAGKQLARPWSTAFVEERRGAVDGR